MPLGDGTRIAIVEVGFAVVEINFADLVGINEVAPVCTEEAGILLLDFS